MSLSSWGTTAASRGGRENLGGRRFWLHTLRTLPYLGGGSVGEESRLPEAQWGALVAVSSQA